MYIYSSSSIGGALFFLPRCFTVFDFGTQLAVATNMIGVLRMCPTARKPGHWKNRPACAAWRPRQTVPATAMWGALLWPSVLTRAVARFR